MKTNIGLMLIATLAIFGCSKKQEIIFEAKSISYKRGDAFMLTKMEEECEKVSKEVSSYMKEGWRVVSSSPKEIPVASNTGMCVVTEYIVEK